VSKRVVVTGVGPVSPVGIGKEKFWQSLINGVSGIDLITCFDASSYPTRIAGEVKGFDPAAFFDKKELRRLDRFSQFAIVATQLALEDAKLKLNISLIEQTAVIVGSGIGGLATLEREHEVLLEKGVRRVSPFLIPMMISNMAAGNISLHFGIKGNSYCPVSACSSSAHAVGEAYEAIKRGDCLVVITGGAEASITPLGIAGFCALRALSQRNDQPQRASRPFDKDRDGFVMGEGAGILILEEAEQALKRKARIYCEVVGYGSTSDAYHMTAPDPAAEQPARAIQLAMREAALTPSEIDYINAHGTSTPYNDEFETLAIKKALGKEAYNILISSTKSMTGHLLGAAGGLESIVCALAIQRDEVPPTINLDEPDPQCDLNYVPHRAVKRPVRAALSNSLGFGGHNVTIAFKKWES
jgi:3-oxoacyl-[acyl-carrier-protein] synthase II